MDKIGSAYAWYPVGASRTGKRVTVGDGPSYKGILRGLWEWRPCVKFPVARSFIRHGYKLGKEHIFGLEAGSPTFGDFSR